MRAMIATLAGLVVLSAATVHATPLPPVKASPAELANAPPIELVRQGWGWHRVRWWDRWDRWHWGCCVPNW